MLAKLQLSDLQAAIFWNSAIILAVVFALFIQWKEMKRLRLSLLLGFVVIAAVNTALVIGSRLGAIDMAGWQGLFHGGVLPHSSGKTILGGILLALPVYLLFKKYWRLPGSLADVIFIALPLAAAVGRLGCVAAGCCHGVITDSWLSWSYGPGMPAYEWQMEQGLIPEGAAASLPVYPVQAFFVVSTLLIFIFLWRIRRKLKAPGSLALLVVGAILLNRAGMEFFREATTNRGILGFMAGGLKIGQWICLLSGGVALGLFWRNERRTVIPKNSSKRVSPLVIAGALFTLAAFILLFHHLLSFEEKVVLTLSYCPAMAAVIRRVWVGWALMPQRLATVSLLSLTAAIVVAVPTDTIPRIVKGDHWIDIGVGGVTGSYQEVSRNCDGRIIDTEKIKLTSAGFDASYNYQLSDKENVGAGVHGSFGEVKSEDPLSENNFNYRALGPYLFFNGKGLGFRGGPLFVNYGGRPVDNGQQYFGPSTQTIFSAYLRVGNRAKYFVDAGYYDFPFAHFSPEPVFSFGLFNWGFEDISGGRTLRLALASIKDELGFVASGRGALGKTNLFLEGSVYVQKEVMVGAGLRYRWIVR
ncbi:MAG: prolipoprotein diacylglyceryl transferase [Lewinellaceae bacterium]|nr:prolipoprotein diacylglyceryl transferase [Lewinellaceae bacterium]